jgi:hypothetical protein
VNQSPHASSTLPTEFTTGFAETGIAYWEFVIVSIHCRVLMSGIFANDRSAVSGQRHAGGAVRTKKLFAFVTDSANPKNDVSDSSAIITVKAMFIFGAAMVRAGDG